MFDPIMRPLHVVGYAHSIKDPECYVCAAPPEDEVASL